MASEYDDLKKEIDSLKSQITRLKQTIRFVAVVSILLSASIYLYVLDNKYSLAKRVDAFMKPSEIERKN